MPLSNGQTFAGYTIIRMLGSGGMGEVYLAQHPRLPRRDALKLLPHDWSADTEYRARFNREADLASTLWHPHIVGVHDRGEENGQLWISMDFVDGLDAARLLADRYPAGMPVDEVARIVTGVASALDYAHKQNLLHRDVKPANIMLTHLDDEGEQRILLTDFGIARNVNDISGLTATNMTVGTVAYSAPEQLLGEDIDGRADQYSLAATAFHLLTGSQLFPNSNPAVVISRHLNSLPPALAHSHPELAALDPVLTAALAKDPDERFPRCAEFARALSEHASAIVGGKASIATTTPAAAPHKPMAAASAPGSPAPPVPTTTATPSWRGWWPTAAVLFGVIALAAGSGLWWQSSRHHQSNAPTTTATTAPTATATGQPSFATSVPPTPLTTSQVPQGNGYALTGCYDSQSPPADRPTDVSLLYCASGGLWLKDMSWTSWGPYGADGAGTAIFKVCEPNCAEGQQVPVPVAVHAWSPLPSPGGSGCPQEIKFYANMILAFPKSEPPVEANTPALSRYNGMPAIEYMTYSKPGPPIQAMSPPFCAGA